MEKKKLIVTNKRDFPEMVYLSKKTYDKWAYISIENTDDFGDNDHYLDDSDDVLNLNFDDVDSEEIYEGIHAYPISDEQGKMIYDFLEAHKGFNLCIHCGAGKSRSQGIARVIKDLFSEYWEEDYLNPCLTPNIAVVSAIKRAYYQYN